MDKKKIPKYFFIVITLIIIISFLSGIFWQRYYSINMFLLDIGIRTLEYSDTKNRVEYDISNLKKPLIIFIFGQSNVANTVADKSYAPENVFNFYEGKLYQAKEPLLGTTGKQGSIWLNTAKHLLTKSSYQEIVLVNIARNNSSIKDWSSQGKFHKTFLNTYKELVQYQLSPQLILLGQGERDGIDEVSFGDYQKHLQEVYSVIKKIHGTKPFLVSITSRCFQFLPNKSIRNAQMQLIKQEHSVFYGPDTDKYNEKYRYDGCHYNQLGNRIISAVWANKIYDALTHKTQNHNNGIM